MRKKRSLIRFIKMSLSLLLQASRKSADLITIEATVPSGFEHVAVEECKDKLGTETKPVVMRGRIFFNAPVKQLDNVELLRSVDNLHIVINKATSLNLTGLNKEEDISILKNIPDYNDIKKVVTVWSIRNNFKGILFPSREMYLSAVPVEEELKATAKAVAESRMKEMENCTSSDLDSDALSEKSEERSKDERTRFNEIEDEAYHEVDLRAPEEKILKYRVTCIRNGKHSFGSQDAAHHVGGTLQDMFHWVVDLNHHDMEVVLYIRDDTMYYGVALTKESKHRRNITHFGPTTLRATICYNLLRLAQPKPGDVVIDPMCGGGSIPIEGLLGYPDCYFLCGDNHEKAVMRTENNLQSPDLGIKRNHVDVFAWNTTCLPLRDSTVDALVTDLPFGKRSGSVFDNRTLYKKVLVELARVIRSETGRAVLLTCDKRSMNGALLYTSALWRVSRKLRVNIGGLEGCVYVLIRLDSSASVPSPHWRGRRAPKIKKKKNINSSPSERT